VHPDITRAGAYVFRTSLMGGVQGRAGAKPVGESLCAKRVVMMTLNNDFGQSLATGFKEKAADFGINIVAEYEYSIRDRELGTIVSKTEADRTDAIYAFGYFFSAGPLVRQLRAAGAIYALIALGLTLVNGLLKILHAAHAALYALGVYIGVTLTNLTGSLAFALCAAMILVGFAGMGDYRFAYRPLLGKPPLVALIASIGIFIASARNNPDRGANPGSGACRGVRRGACAPGIVDATGNGVAGDGFGPRNRYECRCRYRAGSVD